MKRTLQNRENRPARTAEKMKKICIFRRARPSALPPHPPAGRRDRPGKPLPEKDGKNDNQQFFAAFCT